MEKLKEYYKGWEIGLASKMADKFSNLNEKGVAIMTYYLGSSCYSEISSFTHQIMKIMEEDRGKAMDLAEKLDMICSHSTNLKIHPKAENEDDEYEGDVFG